MKKCNAITLRYDQQWANFLMARKMPFLSGKMMSRSKMFFFSFSLHVNMEHRYINVSRYHLLKRGCILLLTSSLQFYHVMLLRRRILRFCSPTPVSFSLLYLRIIFDLDSLSPLRIITFFTDQKVA